MGKKKFTIIIMAAAMVLLFLQGCSDSASSLSDEEKAVLVNKAIEDGGTTSSSTAPALSLSRTIVSGDLISLPGTSTDLDGSAFYATDVTSLWTVYGITYTNLAVSVPDDDGNDVTVVLNGSIYYGWYMNTITYSTSIIVYGNVTGTVDGDPYSFSLDIKTTLAADGSVTVTGTAGGTQIDESY